MGGREVGGLANQLAAHMGFTPPDIDRVRRFWKAPRIATHEGLKAVQMFEAVARGEIKALWVMGTNPAVSLPNADGVREALKKLELFVVSENVVSNDTVDVGRACAAAGAGLGREIRHRDQLGAADLAAARVPDCARRGAARLVDPRRGGEAARLWRGVQLHLGGGYFSRARRALGIRERWRARFRHRRARIAVGRRLRCDGAGAVAGPAGRDPQARFFAEGGFFANDFKARFIAPEIPALRTETTAARPLRLNTGRIRDQWHTMTRTGMSPRLGQHLPEPFVEVHPDDAARYGVADGDFARVTTDYGQCTLRVVVSERQQRGMLFAPIHWSEANATGARVGSLVAPYTDPFSGQPENKATPASIAPYEYVFRGFALSRKPLELPRRMRGRARRRQRRSRLSVRRQCRSCGLAVLAEIVCARRRRRIRGFRRRGLSRGVL